MATTFTATRRVEFSDTDLAGIVHFSRFFIYMEGVEHAFLRSIGTSVLSDYEGKKLGWPRLTATCDYKAPAFFEDELDIRLEVIRKGNRSLTYAFTFMRGNTLIAEGRMATACCTVEPGGKMKAVVIPITVANGIEETE